MTDTDRIVLRGMRFQGRVGVGDEERRAPQPMEVDVEMALHLARAAATDDLADTVDYAAVFEVVRGIVESRQFRLLETLAGAIAEGVLAAHPLSAVTVRVRKPMAPLPGAFDTVEVELRREGSA